MQRLLSIFTLAICLAACGITPQQQNSEPSWAAHVSYEGQWLEVQDLRTWRSSDTGLEIMMRIRSKALMDRNIRYRVLWYTEDGRPIKTLLGKWNERLIKSGQVIDITESSPGPKAADYRIEIED